MLLCTRQGYYHQPLFPKERLIYTHGWQLSLWLHLSDHSVPSFIPASLQNKASGPNTNRVTGHLCPLWTARPRSPSNLHLMSGWKYRWAVNQPPMSRLQWEKNQIAQMHFNQCTDRDDCEIRTWGLAMTWPDLYLHTGAAPHEPWMQCRRPGAVIMCIPGASVHPLQREKQTRGVDNGDELKAQADILYLCMTDKNQRTKSTLIYILCLWRTLESWSGAAETQSGLWCASVR